MMHPYEIYSSKYSPSAQIRLIIVSDHILEIHPKAPLNFGKFVENLTVTNKSYRRKLCIAL